MIARRWFPLGWVIGHGQSQSSIEDLYYLAVQRPDLQTLRQRWDKRREVHTYVYSAIGRARVDVLLPSRLCRPEVAPNECSDDGVSVEGHDTAVSRMLRVLRTWILRISTKT